MDQIGFARFKCLGTLIPLLHDKLMGDLQLVKDDVEDFNVETVGLTLVVSELIGRKLPVADNDERAVFGIFSC